MYSNGLCSITCFSRSVRTCVYVYSCSNRFRFLFINTLSCLAWQLVSAHTPSNNTSLSNTALSLSPSFLLPQSYVYSFSIIGSIYFSQLLALGSVFVYASFWFSRLKLYLLFLFSLVIRTVSKAVKTIFRLLCRKPSNSSYLPPSLTHSLSPAQANRTPFWFSRIPFCLPC